MTRTLRLSFCLVVSLALFCSSAHASTINMPSVMYLMGTSDYWVGNASPDRYVPLEKDKEYSEERTIQWPNSSKVATGAATVSAKLGPSPSVSSYLWSKNGGIGLTSPSYTNGYEVFYGYKIPGQAYSKLEYYFYISGPESISVPIIIDYNLKIMSSGSVYDQSRMINAWVAAEASIRTIGGFGDRIAILHGDTANTIERNSSLSLDVMANLQSPAYKISLASGVFTHNYASQYEGLMEGYAFADPVIRIDPSFADANLYTVLLSEGAGNSWTSPPAPTPEPGTALLMGVGLLVVGAAARRKRLHA